MIADRRRAFASTVISDGLWNEDSAAARELAHDYMKRVLIEYGCDLSTFTLVQDGVKDHRHLPVHLSSWQRWLPWLFKQHEPEAYTVYLFKAWAWEKIDAT